MESRVPRFVRIQQSKAGEQEPEDVVLREPSNRWLLSIL